MIVNQLNQPIASDHKNLTDGHDYRLWVEPHRDEDVLANSINNSNSCTAITTNTKIITSNNHVPQFSASNYWQRNRLRSSTSGIHIIHLDQAHVSFQRSLTTYILWQQESESSLMNHTSNTNEGAQQQQQKQQQETDAPRLKYLWIGLLASCILFFLSGLDGSRYCQQYYSQSNPDIANSCHHIFITKVAPTSLVLASCCLFSIRELALAGKVLGRRRRGVRIHAVGISAVLCLIVCTMSVITIMLIPQTNHNVQQDLDQLYRTTTTTTTTTTGDNNNYYNSNNDDYINAYNIYTNDDTNNKNNNINNNNEEEFKEFFFHSPSIPYSLYAVNGLGEIGDNANLYHAIFGSFIFAFIIAHQYLYALALLHLCKSYLYWKKNRLKKTLFFRHRERVGSWIAILVAASLVLISSSLLWKEVLGEQCSSTTDNDDYDVQQNNNNNRLTMISIHPRICSSTELAIMMGTIGMILSLFSVLVHSSSHRFATRTIPLSLEGATSFLLVLFYGFGNMFVTGSYQGGLAENVGNLYYATWGCFLFSLRVFIGCVEEAHSSPDHHEEEDIHNSNSFRRRTTNSITTTTSATHNIASPSTHCHNHGGATSSLDPQGEIRNDNNSYSEKPKVFIKRWLILALLSAINHGAAYDAAQQMYFTTFGYNTGSLQVMIATYGSSMSVSQQWSLLCPFFVMCFSIAMAVSHLWPPTYRIVASSHKGLLLALLASTLCASQILISQHAANSFAVNHVGGIVSANLYYFTWGSMVCAALNVKFYYHRINPSAESSVEFIQWFGLVKIGLIMVGASSHLWLAIKEDCAQQQQQQQQYTNYNTYEQDDDIANMLLASSSFCGRTKFSLYAGLVATALSTAVSAMLVLKYEYAMWFHNIVGSCLTVLFTFGAGWITGMGGPAESVGDLYYSTWLAYAVSIAISSSWIKKLLKETLLISSSSSSGNNNAFALATSINCENELHEEKPDVHAKLPHISSQDHCKVSTTDERNNATIGSTHQGILS